MKTSSAPFAARLFAWRGWLLATLFLAVLVARALTPATDAPLRPEWLIYVAAAALLRLWAGAHLGDHGNGAEAVAPRLARTGPYRLSRNPLYIANILASAGLVLYANALPLPAELALIALVIVHHIMIVRHEEKILRAAHGDDYARYTALVPRWYGLMRPHGSMPDAVEDPTTKPSLKNALRRQGRNVVYMALCALALWYATRGLGAHG